MSICKQNGLGSRGADELGIFSNGQEERAVFTATLGRDASFSDRSGGHSERVGRGLRWSKEERRGLWECFIRSGGVWSGGYIEKVRVLWEERGFCGRTLPSMISQLKEIRSGRHLSVMEKDEIRRKVELDGRMEISEGLRDEILGESDVSSFSGFGNADEDRHDDEIDFEEEDKGVRETEL